MALKIEYENYASFLLTSLRDNSATIFNRNIQLLTTELFKVKNA